MEATKLDSGSIEDLELDLLPLIEKSFNIRFENNELVDTTNIEDLISRIIEKLDSKDDDLCTSLIAFYQLRNSLHKTNLYDAEKLSPATPLRKIFSDKKNRIQDAKILENHLGYKIDILSPAPIVTLLFIIAFSISAIILFFNFIVGIGGIIISSILIRIAYKNGKELKYKTIRDLIENTVCENYLSYRNNRDSINRKELRSILLDWFSANLYIEKDELRNANFQ